MKEMGMQALNAENGGLDNEEDKSGECELENEVLRLYI